MQISGVYFDEDKLKEFLENLGLTIVGETSTDLQLYCCFHDNHDTPAMTMSKQPPLYPWMCWNGACGQRGNIISLLTKRGYSYQEVTLMLNSQFMVGDDFAKFIEKLFKDETATPNEWANVDWQQFREADRVSGYPARQYCRDRGISGAAYEFFQIGYSIAQNKLVIPVFDHMGNLRGLIGRSIQDKQYKYSAHLPRNTLIWNLNNILDTHRPYIALTEGAFDAMYLWDAGVTAAGAILGSSIGPQQIQLVREHFYEVIPWFDNDEPGRAAVKQCVNEFTDKTVSIVEYPHAEAKDPGLLTQQEIRKMFRGRRLTHEILLQKPEFEPARPLSYANGIMDIEQ